MQNRIFEILENVAKYGPITLDELAQKTAISRSATFRGLKRLEDGGWIRLRLDGRQYVLTSRVEQKLNSKVEPKKEIEQLTPVITQSIDLKSIRTRIFQQETTVSAELVDDSIYKCPERNEQVMAADCCRFLLQVLQYAGFAVGKPQLDEAQLVKAQDILRKLESCDFAIVSEHRFLWLPVFSRSSEVFLLCLSCRNLGHIDSKVGHKLAKNLKQNAYATGLTTFQNLKMPRLGRSSAH
ncbi:MarR family transcriptional regulator [Roseobacter denitrificans]|uniref:MarR family transcriptional regulator n=1 Tax=Roseobacter denitrificans TaxID=2434 RepID=UPI0008EC844D|nr:MarR family transcriptional regulator [Roseobacter denitrificans]SFG32826.1 MarR family protein [Roseobacter denitrificans OCh 114]